MLRLWFLALGLCGAAVAAQAASPGRAPVGQWLTQDHRAVIDIAPCGDALCGRIVGLTLKTTDAPLPDDWQGKPQCGEQILRVTPDGTDWVGHVLDPRSGDVYQARLALDPKRDLKLRGWLGVPLLGQTQLWTPFPAKIGADCRLLAAKPG